MVTGSFPGVKRPGRGVDHPPHLALRLRTEYSYTSTPLLGLRDLFYGTVYIIIIIIIIIIIKKYSVCGT
jgi:hypothetical protein